MNYFNNLPFDIKDIIYDFSDNTQYWKTRFTNDVLPKIDQGYKLVGLLGKNTICTYCYVYADTGLKKKSLCMFCEHNTDYISINYKTYKTCNSKAVSTKFDTYENYKKWHLHYSYRLINRLPNITENELFLKMIYLEVKREERLFREWLASNQH